MNKIRKALTVGALTAGTAAAAAAPASAAVRRTSARVAFMTSALTASIVLAAPPASADTISNCRDTAGSGAAAGKTFTTCATGTVSYTRNWNGHAKKAVFTNSRAGANHSPKTFYFDKVCTKTTFSVVVSGTDSGGSVSVGTGGLTGTVTWNSYTKTKSVTFPNKCRTTAWNQSSLYDGISFSTSDGIITSSKMTVGSTFVHVAKNIDVNASVTDTDSAGN